MNLRRTAIWAAAILLAFALVLAGETKLTGPSAPGWAARFARWGYPPIAAPVVGVLEILSALGVLIPRTRRVAAAVVVGLMIGAFGTHLVHGEFVRLIVPLVLGGLAFLISWRSAPQSRVPAAPG